MGRSPHKMKRVCSAVLTLPLQKRPRLVPVFLLALAIAALLAAAVSTAQQAPTATIGPAPVQIAPPRPNYPFPDGKSYVYSAEWHLITAGTGVVRMEVAGNERKVVATAKSPGPANVF